MTLMAVMALTATRAQMAPSATGNTPAFVSILGEKHAMLRMPQDKKYVLLPVQETEEIAAIAVLDSRNEMVQRINVKLVRDCFSG